MVNRKFFGTTELITNFVDKLTKVSTLDGGWSTEYVDDETGQHWLRYVVDDRVFFEHMMCVSPKPTIDELIDIAFTSPYLDEVSAAATRLNIEERTDKIEYRQKLVDRLNQIRIDQLDGSGKERINAIIHASQLTDKVNKRDIFGKHFSEIQQDAAFFKSMADRAEEILSMLRA